jgi:hypothetical protein
MRALLLIAALLCAACGPDERVAHEATMRDTLAQMRTALAHFEDDNGRYPHSLDELVPRYLPRVPADPVTKSATTWRLTTGGARAAEQRLLDQHRRSVESADRRHPQRRAGRGLDRQTVVGLLMPNVYTFKDFEGSSHRILIDLIRRHSPGGTLLDLGAAGGELGAALREHFDRTIGFGQAPAAEGRRDRAR